MFSFTFS